MCFEQNKKVAFTQSVLAWQLSLSSQFFYLVLILFILSSTPALGQIAKTESKLSTSLSFSLENIALGQSKPIYFSLPFARDRLYSHDKLSLTWDGQAIPFSSYAHLYWPKQKQANIQASAIRGLIIKLPIAMSGKYELTWSKASSALKKSQVIGQVPLYAKEYTKVKMDKKWLNEALLIPALSFRPGTQLHDLYWFDEGLYRHGLYLVDDSLANMRKKKQATKASPWLYDPVYNYYQLYLRTGNDAWKDDAHKAAQFYLKNIGEDGYFKLKKGDLKYLNPMGLVYEYLFYPRPELISAMRKMYRNSLAWPAHYNPAKGFWTERNLATALSLAFSLWQLESNQQAFKRMQDLISGIKKHMEHRADSNCLAHTYSQHEGKKDNTLVCSPWMTALLAEQLWQIQQVIPQPEIDNMLIGFSDFILEKTLEQGDGVHLSGYIYPQYLHFFTPSKYFIKDQFRDIQHACDIAGMVAKGLYIKQKQERKILATDREKLQGLLKTCKKTVYHPYRKTPYWSLAPIRKFNWWFSTNVSLTWLIKVLNMPKLN